MRPGQPTATEAGVDVVQYSASAPQEGVDTILANYTGKRILIIGHSNTVDDMVIEKRHRVPGAGESPFAFVVI